jgi:hypothetical protein
MDKKTRALYQALELLVMDNEKRGSLGQEVNWAAVHQGREALNNFKPDTGTSWDLSAVGGQSSDVKK